jgi:hypothetical protein
LPVALLFACSLLVVACVVLIAPCYGRSLVIFQFIAETRPWLLVFECNAAAMTVPALKRVPLGACRHTFGLMLRAEAF